MPQHTHGRRAAFAPIKTSLCEISTVTSWGRRFRLGFFLASCQATQGLGFGFGQPPCLGARVTVFRVFWRRGSTAAGKRQGVLGTASDDFISVEFFPKSQECSGKPAGSGPEFVDLRRGSGISDARRVGVGISRARYCTLEKAVHCKLLIL